MSNNYTVLYISSASRSGSTLIEDCLARKLQGVSCGELYRISDFYDGDARVVKERGAYDTCACGEEVSKCPYWCEIAELSGVDLSVARMRSQLSAVQRFWFRLCVGVGGPRFTRALARVLPSFRRELEVGRNCQAIYSAIAKQTGAKVILDSSKQAHQYYILKAVMPGRLKLISLVRDGRAVVASMTKGTRGVALLSQKDQKNEKTLVVAHEIQLVAIRAWLVSTAKSLIAFAITGKRNRVFVRYEQFARNPLAQMERLISSLSLLGLGTATRGADSHAIGGSPSRNTIGFEEILVDDTWKSLPKFKSSRPEVIAAKLLNQIIGYDGKNFVNNKK